MRRIHARSTPTKMIELESFFDLPFNFLVIKPVSGDEDSPHPKSGIAVLLSDGENMASGLRVDNNIRFLPVSPPRYLGVVGNAAAVFGARAQFKVIGVTACANPAKVIESHFGGNWAVSLLPEPAMAEVGLTRTSNAAISVRFVPRQYPTSRLFIRRVWDAPTMAGEVHLRLASDVPKPRIFGNRRLLSAPAETQSSPADSFGRDLVMASQVSHVAASDPAFMIVGADRNGPETSTHTESGGVGASRVVRLLNAAAIAQLSLSKPRVVAFQKARFACQQFAASAFTRLDSLWRGLRRSLRQFCRKQFRVVAFNETAMARRSAVGADDDLTASAMAKSFAKLSCGHRISPVDRWFGWIGVSAPIQPFVAVPHGRRGLKLLYLGKRAGGGFCIVSPSHWRESHPLSKQTRKGAWRERMGFDSGLPYGVRFT